MKATTKARQLLAVLLAGLLAWTCPAHAGSDGTARSRTSHHAFAVAARTGHHNEGNRSESAARQWRSKSSADWAAAHLRWMLSIPLGANPLTDSTGVNCAINQEGPVWFLSFDDARDPACQEDMHRHAGIAWAKVQARLEGNPDSLGSLQEMEATGGEPDVIGQDQEADHFTFCDCSPESPTGRRSTCYDLEARESRKEHKPEDSAVEMAAAMGIDLLTEERYRELQKLGGFDTKTSSWIRTPPDVRALGGAFFCDRRYGKVFVYHNGAQSYYAARGFRGSLRV